MVLQAWIIAAELPAPPALERWTVENPWPAAAALLALAFVAFIRFWRLGQARRGAIFAGIGALAAAAVVAAAALITTEREELTNLTSGWLRSVFDADADAAGELIDERLVTASAGTVVENMGRQELLAVVRGFIAFEVSDWVERARGASIDGPDSGRTRVTVRARVNSLGESVIPSTWELSWSRTGERWKIVRLECLTMWGQPPKADWAAYARRISASLRGNRNSTIRGLVRDRF